jgi:hypothetical protein
VGRDDGLPLTLALTRHWRDAETLGFLPHMARCLRDAAHMMADTISAIAPFDAVGMVAADTLGMVTTVPIGTAAATATPAGQI